MMEDKHSSQHEAKECWTAVRGGGGKKKGKSDEERGGVEDRRKEVKVTMGVSSR